MMSTRMLMTTMLSMWRCCWFEVVLVVLDEVVVLEEEVLDEVDVDVLLLLVEERRC